MAYSQPSVNAAIIFLNNVNFFKILIGLTPFDHHNIIGGGCPIYLRHGERKDIFKFTKSLKDLFL